MFPSRRSEQALVSLDLNSQGLDCELGTDLLATFYALQRLDLSHNALSIE